MRGLLGFAYNWHVRAFDTDISISRYLDGWGRQGDSALIAMEGGHSIGAAWYRLFPETQQGYGYIDESTPELTLVVVPTKQGQGVGTRLLAAALNRARGDDFASISASVQRGTRELETFLKGGFEQVREDGENLILRCDL